MQKHLFLYVLFFNVSIYPMRATNTGLSKISKSIFQSATATTIAAITPRRSSATHNTTLPTQHNLVSVYNLKTPQATYQKNLLVYVQATVDQVLKLNNCHTKLLVINASDDEPTSYNPINNTLTLSRAFYVNTPIEQIFDLLRFLYFHINLERAETDSLDEQKLAISMKTLLSLSQDELDTHLFIDPNTSALFNYITSSSVAFACHIIKCNECIESLLFLKKFSDKYTPTSFAESVELYSIIKTLELACSKTAPHTCNNHHRKVTINPAIPSDMWNLVNQEYENRTEKEEQALNTFYKTISDYFHHKTFASMLPDEIKPQ